MGIGELGEGGLERSLNRALVGLHLPAVKCRAVVMDGQAKTEGVRSVHFDKVASLRSPSKRGSSSVFWLGQGAPD